MSSFRMSFLVLCSLILSVNTLGYLQLKQFTPDPELGDRSSRLPHLKLEFFSSPQSISDWLREIYLVKAISEPEDNRVHDFILHVDEQDEINFLIRRSGDATQEIAMEDLLNGEVVIARSSDKDALLLSCPSFDMEEGGVFVIRYLYNGIIMTYRTFELKLVKVHYPEGQDSWVLKTVDDILVETLHIVSRKILGTVVGIKEIGVNRG